MNPAEFIIEGCPSVQELAEYLNEEPHVNSVLIETHLQSCDPCVETISRLSDETSLWQDWPLITPAPSTETEEMVPVLDRIKQKGEWQQPLPVIEGYRVLGVIGRGASAIVYRAEQQTPRRQVAIKMLLKVHQADEKLLARFQSEADLVARLVHSNISPVYEVGCHQGAAWFTMPFFEGGSLSDRLDGTPLPARVAARLMRIVAQAIQVAHQQGVVHRDLKPANLLLKFGEHDKLESAQPVISDFGVAKSLREQIDRTQTGEVVGTASYMAPEQVQGAPGKVGPSADIYAIGAILYELISGKPPFKSETPTETLLQVLHHEPIAPRRLQPGLSRDVETICMQCLAKNPHQRYQTAEDLADDLERFLQGQPITARPVGPVRRTSKWIRRQPASAALIGLCVLATISLLGLWLNFTIQLKDQRDTILNTAKQLEKEQRQASESFQRAKNAIGDYLNTLRKHQQLAGYDLLPLKKDLLSSGAAFYEKLLRENLGYLTATDIQSALPAVNLEHAGLFLELGKLHFETRDFERSLQSLQLSYEISTNAFVGDSIFDNVAFARLKGVICLSESRLHLALGDASRAIEKARESIGIFRELGVRQALDPGYQNWYMANANHRLAAACREANQLDEALQAANQSIGHASQLIAIPDFQLTLGQSHLQRGLVRRELNQGVDSLADLQDACDILEHISLTSWPRSKRYEEPRSQCLFELARHFDKVHQTEQAISALEKAIDCQHEIYRMQPRIKHVGQRLAEMYETLADWLERSIDADAGQVAYANASLIRSKISKEPRTPTSLFEQVRHRVDLADALAKELRFEEAVGQYLMALDEIDHQRVTSSEGGYPRIAREILFKLTIIRFDRQEFNKCIGHFEALTELESRLDSQDATRFAISLAASGFRERALEQLDGVSTDLPSSNGSIGQLPVVFFLVSAGRPEETQVDRGVQLFHACMDQIKQLNVTQRMELAYGLCWAATLCEDQASAIAGPEEFPNWADEMALRCLMTIDPESHYARTSLKNQRFKRLHYLPLFRELQQRATSTTGK